MPVWTQNEFPFLGGGGSVPTVNGQQAGSTPSVPCDGQVTAITVPSRYATAMTSATATATTGSLDSSASISCNVVTSSLTTTGFSVFVSGGESGDTCTIYWTTEGN